MNLPSKKFRNIDQKIVPERNLDTESKYVSKFFVAFMVQKLQTLKVDHLFLTISNKMAMSENPNRSEKF